MSKISVYIVDDHNIVVDGLKTYFIGNSDFEVSGSAQNAQDLFKDLKLNIPDILILDIKLDGMSGLQIAKIVSKNYPDIKIIFLSSDVNKDILNDAIKSGGKGFLNKDVTEQEFLDGLKRVWNGEYFYSKTVQALLFEDYANQVLENKEKKDNKLTDREIDVIKQLSNGLSYKEIAATLNISARTVEKHKKNIQDKLNISSTAELIKYAILNGLVDL